MKKHNKVKNQVRTVNNGLASAVGVDMYNNASLPLEIEANATIGLLTLNWVTLVNTYKSNGFVKLAVDMPVDDAFRGGGFEFESGTLEAEELEELNEKVKELDLEAVKQVARWGRLFGGGVLLCETGQKLDTPFNPETIYNKEVEFLACDRWQCYPVAETLSLAKTFVLQDLSLKENGGIIAEVDKSRLKTFIGEAQPYYIRNQLQGWGISLLECIIPQLNQYLKANRVILELLDEAKIDILKIFGLADNLMSADGESAVKRRVSIFATQKNYKNVGVMDTQDDYDQKTMQFGGIDRLLEKIFLLICSSLRIPYSKVFGRGASGFSSGEDDLENYNAMIMSSVRVPITPLLKWVGQIRACQLFGRKVDDLSVKWKSLRVLTEKEEQEIRTQKINSYLQLLQAGVINRKQVAEQLQKDDIMAFSPEELKELENDTNFEEIEEEGEIDKKKVENSKKPQKRSFWGNLCANAERWITIKPHGDDSDDYRRLKLKDGETPKEAIDRVYKKEEKKEKKSEKENYIGKKFYIGDEVEEIEEYLESHKLYRGKNPDGQNWGARLYTKEDLERFMPKGYDFEKETKEREQKKQDKEDKLKYFKELNIKSMDYKELQKVQTEIKDFMSSSNIKYEERQNLYKKYDEVSNQIKRTLIKEQADRIGGYTKKLNDLCEFTSLSDISGYSEQLQEHIYDNYKKVYEKFPLVKYGGIRKEKLRDNVYANNASSINYVTLNSKFYDDIEKLKESYERTVKSQFHPQGTDYNSIIVHELGHGLLEYITKKTNKTGAEIRESVLKKLKIKQKDVKEHLSEYAMYKPREAHEFFAEAFAEYITSENPRPLAKEFGKEIEKIIEVYKLN